MAQPFVGQIQLFGFNFAPRGWALCMGQLIPIQQNTALFSLLGTTYGGNGTSNFALPNFGGNAACGQGQGSGLSSRVMGETFGASSVTLLTTEMPAHSHALNIYTQPDPSKRQSAPASGSALATPGSPSTTAFSVPPPNTTFAPQMLTAASGGNQPHQNQQPYLAVNFCIALQGIFPARN